MADVIQLLPDHVANQIAAGEVVQRPASVVKELMENAIDAGSTNVKLLIKDAGRTLIQVVDNGCGMSVMDARMCFERHATSKIRQAKDLHSIRTMGFRGEALASIASIAHVEMKTKRQIDEVGTKILIEGSEVKVQEPCQCNPGTSLAIKNLFFNVPARRNFLKSDNVEIKHISDEFQRVAMAHPDVFFSFHHNDQEIYHLPPGNLRQRITGILGPNSNKKLVPVFEETDVLKISGFVGKPEFSRKTRGDQWFFVNSRFIKSTDLHQAVLQAFENLLPKENHPLYVIFFEIDPARIDVNVHPTKQEIKFEDEKLINNYLRVAIKHALGQHSIIPSLDFDQEVNFGSKFPLQYPETSDLPSVFSNSPKSADMVGRPKSDSGGQYSSIKNWTKLFEGIEEIPDDEFEMEGELFPVEQDEIPAITIESQWSLNKVESPPASSNNEHRKPTQIHNIYILSPIKSGFLLIDQQNAHERILYEQFLKILNQREQTTQQQLFPKTIQLSVGDSALMKNILPEVNMLGFDIQEFGENAFVINGLPSVLTNKIDEKQLVELLLEQFKQNMELKLEANENIARAMSRSASIKRGQSLSMEEMESLINQLFACELPFKSPSGKNCFITYGLDELAKRFEA